MVRTGAIGCEPVRTGAIFLGIFAPARQAEKRRASRGVKIFDFRLGQQSRNDGGLMNAGRRKLRRAKRIAARHVVDFRMPRAKAEENAFVILTLHHQFKRISLAGGSDPVSALSVQNVAELLSPAVPALEPDG